MHKLILLNQLRDDITLDKKVDDFIKWYSINVVSKYYNGVGLYNKPREMRNFIEKMASWYELRYPDADVDKALFYSNSRSNISEVMFEKNEYINELFDDDADIRYLDWEDFYNTKVFIKSLSYEEKQFLEKPYPDRIYLSGRIPHLHLSEDGKVIKADKISCYYKDKVKDEELLGLRIEEVIQLFEKRDIELHNIPQIIESVTNYKNEVYQREEMLNCVMYRIIERGGNRIGPRRALLFAKEFNRNIDIPMKYGVDTKDPDLRWFINEYINLGGNKDLECYRNYFDYKTRHGYINTINISDLLLTKNDNGKYYTDKEDLLHQRLVDILDSSIDNKELDKEKVKQLRLNRKKNKN